MTKEAENLNRFLKLAASGFVFKPANIWVRKATGHKVLHEIWLLLAEGTKFIATGYFFNIAGHEAAKAKALSYEACMLAYSWPQNGKFSIKLAMKWHAFLQLVTVIRQEPLQVFLQ